jgi:hypothetical protein
VSTLSPSAEPGEESDVVGSSRLQPHRDWATPNEERKSERRALLFGLINVGPLCVHGLSAQEGF